MEKDILGEVIEVEKEIQRCLEEERLKARDRLQKLRKESEEELEREEIKIRESFRESLQSALHDAETRASAMVQSSLVKSERLHRLDDETIVRTLMKRITAILPE
jgi:vacuolar-type H+-ATPase subunit H